MSGRTSLIAGLGLLAVVATGCHASLLNMYNGAPQFEVPVWNDCPGRSVILYIDGEYEARNTSRGRGQRVLYEGSPVRIKLAQGSHNFLVVTNTRTFVRQVRIAGANRVNLCGQA